MHGEIVGGAGPKTPRETRPNRSHLGLRSLSHLPEWPCPKAGYWPFWSSSPADTGFSGLGKPFALEAGAKGAIRHHNGFLRPLCTADHVRQVIAIKRSATARCHAHPSLNTPCISTAEATVVYHSTGAVRAATPGHHKPRSREPHYSLGAPSAKDLCVGTRLVARATHPACARQRPDG